MYKIRTSIKSNILSLCVVLTFSFFIFGIGVSKAVEGGGDTGEVLGSLSGVTFKALVSR